MVVARPEQLEIATVRNDVVDRGCGGDASVVGALATERLVTELRDTNVLPSGAAIECTRRIGAALGVDVVAALALVESAAAAVSESTAARDRTRRLGSGRHMEMGTLASGEGRQAAFPGMLGREPADALLQQAFGVVGARRASGEAVAGGEQRLADEVLLAVRGAPPDFAGRGFLEGGETRGTDLWVALRVHFVALDLIEEG